MVGKFRVLAFSCFCLLMQKICQFLVHSDVSFGLISGQFHTVLDCAIFIVILRVGHPSAPIQLSLKPTFFLFDILHLIRQFNEFTLICGRIRQRLWSNIKTNCASSDQMLCLSTVRITLDCWFAVQHKLRIIGDLTTA